MTLTVQSDDHYMKQAFQEAEQAYEEEEVPVGAVVVVENTIIARAHNLTERLTDATAHAEMQAITAASEYMGGKFLNECTLYVTLEPCVMCAGALYWTRMGRVVYGTRDEKKGYTLTDPGLLHPRTEVKTGVMAEEAGELLRRFFREQRGK